MTPEQIDAAVELAAGLYDDADECDEFRVKLARAVLYLAACLEREPKIDTHSAACHNWHLPCALRRIRELEDACRAMMERYLALASSGDAGQWNPEVEDEVKSCRAVLGATD